MLEICSQNETSAIKYFPNRKGELSMMQLAKRVLFVFGFLAFSTVSLADLWKIDGAHSTARFKIRHLMIANVSGELTGIKGTFNVDEKDITKLKAEATIDASTLNTNNADRDKHLKSADFFDVQKYPTISYKSKRVMKEADGKFKLVGDLTIHGVTKEVTLLADALTPAIKDPWGNIKRGFFATTQLNRSDFKITWNKTLETGGLLIGETADIAIELELVGEAPKSPRG